MPATRLGYVIAGRKSADAVTVFFVVCLSIRLSQLLACSPASAAAVKMPVVVMHGGSGAAGGGNTALSSKSMGPNSHLCIAIITLVVNPPLGRCRHCIPTCTVSNYVHRSRNVNGLFIWRIINRKASTIP